MRLRKIGLSVKDLEAIEHKIEKAIKWLDENPDVESNELEATKVELCID